MVEISELENKMHDQKMNVRTGLFFKKFSKLDKHLAKLMNN